MAEGPLQGRSRRQGWLLVSRWLAAHVDPVGEGARDSSPEAIRTPPVGPPEPGFLQEDDSRRPTSLIQRLRVHDSWWNEPPRDTAQDDVRWVEILNPALVEGVDDEAIDRGRRSRLRRLLVSDFPAPPLRREPDELTVQVLELPRKRLFSLVQDIAADDVSRTFDPANFPGGLGANAPALFTALDATFETQPRPGEISVSLPAIGLRVLAIPFSQRPQAYAEAVARRFERPAGRAFLRADEHWRQYGIPDEYDEYEWIARHLGSREILGPDDADTSFEQES